MMLRDLRKRGLKSWRCTIVMGIWGCGRHWGNSIPLWRSRGAGIIA
jgi:hypothetical protein